MQLTQKENSCLKDLKSQEQLCVDKYAKHADAASDPQLKNLLNEIAAVERAHFETLTKMTSDPGMVQAVTAPAPNGNFDAHYGADESAEKKNDCYICSDLLATEKHASGLYDTFIFEFTAESQRNILNGIQKDEQKHGKLIYDYMAKNGMYS